MAKKQGKMVTGGKGGRHHHAVKRLAKTGAFISEVGAVKRDAYSIVSSGTAQGNLERIRSMKAKKSA